MAKNESYKKDWYELDDIMDNYRNIISANEPKVYDYRYGREFSQSEINAYLIAVLFMFSPIFISAMFSLLLNIYGLVFFIIFGIPTLLSLIFIGYFNIQKYILTKWCINTDFGKSRISMKKYKDSFGLFIYFYKTVQNAHIKKNIFSYLLPSNRPKYSKLIIIKDTFKRIDNLLTYIRDLNDGEVFNLSTLIDNPILEIEYIDIEEKQKNKININTAKVSQLKKLPFISNEDAVRIAKHIQKNGEFDTLWDFMEFINFEPEKLETLYKYIFVKQTGKKLPVSEQIKQDFPQFDNKLDI